MNAPGPQDPKNAPAPPSMMEQCERQLRDYFLRLAENDEALANAYYDAISPMLLKQALGQMLGSGLGDMFGREAPPREFQPTKTAARAMAHLHTNVKQSSERNLPVFQSIEDIKRYTADIHQRYIAHVHKEAQARRRAEKEDKIPAVGAGTELVTQPFSTSDWVTAYFAPPPSEDAKRDLEFPVRDISEQSLRKTRRSLLGMMFGKPEEETRQQKIPENSVYYLAPVHKGGPIVVEGRVKISSAPAGATIIATGDVHVDRVQAGAFIVAGGNITVGETGSRAVLISGKSAKIDYVGTYARVYAREHAQVSNSGESVCVSAGISRSFPPKKWRERPAPQEAAEIVKEFCDVMDTIQNEPGSVTRLRELFAEGIVALSGGALNLEDVPVLQLPAPRKEELTVEEEYREREEKLRRVFARYAGQRHSLSVVENMRKEMKEAGYELRVLDEDSLMTMDINHRRVNVKINWDYDGKKYLAKKFTLG